MCKLANTDKAEIDARVILDDLVQARVISFDDHEMTKSLKSSARLNYLIRIVLRRPRELFLPFCDVLSSKYDSVANSLLYDADSDCPTGKGNANNHKHKSDFEKCIVANICILL